MADTIRDVIIKLKIQQDSAKLTAPDTSVLEKAVQESADRQAKIIQETLTNAYSGVNATLPSVTGAGLPTVTPKSSGGGGSSKVSQIDTLREGIKEAERMLPELQAAFEKVEGAAKEEAAIVHESILQTIEDAKKQLAELEATETKRVELLQQSSAKFKSIAERERIAAFERQRAAVIQQAVDKAAAAAQKEYELSSKRAQAELNAITADLRSAGEGAFRAARGFALLTTDTDQLTVVLKRLAVVQGAWDTFSGGLNTIRGVSDAWKKAADNGGLYEVVLRQISRAQGALATGLSAVTKFLGPLPTVIAGVTAAVLAGGSAWEAYAEEVDVFIQDIPELKRGFEEISRLQSARLGRTIASDDLSREIKLLNDKATLTEKAVDAEKRSFEIRRVLVNENRQLLENQAREFKAEDEARKSALTDIEKIHSAQERLIDVERTRLDLIRSQKSELQESLNKQSQIVEKAKEALDTERSMVNSARESLGTLDPVQQAELKRLGEKVKSGQELNSGEVQRVADLAGETGRQFQSRFNVQRGTGLEGLLTPFNNGVNLVGQGSKFDDALRKYQAAQEESVRLNEEVIKKITELNVREKVQVTEIVRLLNLLFAGKGALEDLRKELARMDEQRALDDVKAKR